MQREKTILLMLLIPLLLGALVFFAQQKPSSAFTTWAGQDAQEGSGILLGLQEQAGEEPEFSCAALPTPQRMPTMAMFGDSGPVFGSSPATAALAIGWRLPLRI